MSLSVGAAGSAAGATHPTVPLGAQDGAGALADLDAALVLSLRGGSVLGAFNRAGVLAAADVHVALRLSDLGGDEDDMVTLAAALAVRAPRIGNVRVDLAAVRATAAADVDEDVDVSELPWPDPAPWLERLRRSPLVSVGEEGPEDRPLRLVGSSLYLDRYWRDERAVAADLAERAAWRIAGPGPADGALGGILQRLFPDDASGEQRWAAAAAALGRLAVIAGGPGTGKTTTIARLVATLFEEAAGRGGRPPLVALAAPTGKAAVRMEEAVRGAAALLEVSEEVRARMTGLGASTLHRLLVPRPGNTGRFRYDRHNRLPHDVVVVDETSMLSLYLMARLTEAVRPDARLVLVGDPEQLASVEAGAVLGDIVGPASGGLRMRPAAAAQLAAVTGVAQEDGPPPAAGVAIGDAVVLLRANHRFTGALATLAAAVRAGDAGGALEVLSSRVPEVSFLDVDPSTEDAEALEPLRLAAVDAASGVLAAARGGDGAAALGALGRFRLLCAHRRGPAGVAVWNARLESWLADAVAEFEAASDWYVGRPVIVTRNDYGLRLFNGDTGVVVAREGAGQPTLSVAFERGRALVFMSPSRLADVETVYATTVHKAQGSEFDSVAVVLPEPGSRVLTRELLYTAVTRAKERLILAGTEAAVRAAVERPVSRASGLTERLWGAD